MGDRPPLPEGWHRTSEDNGRFYYLTRHPQVKIARRSQLESYHLRGKYLEMRLADLNFGTVTRAKKYSKENIKSSIASANAKKRSKEETRKMKIPGAKPSSGSFDGDNMTVVEDNNHKEIEEDVVNVSWFGNLDPIIEEESVHMEDVIEVNLDTCVMDLSVEERVQELNAKVKDGDMTAVRTIRWI